DSKRSVGVVLADVSECLRKAGICHGRHGDQEVVREIGGRATHKHDCKRGPPSAQLAAFPRAPRPDSMRSSALRAFGAAIRTLACAALAATVWSVADPAAAKLVIMHGYAELTSAIV